MFEHTEEDTKSPVYAFQKRWRRRGESEKENKLAIKMLQTNFSSYYLCGKKVYLLRDSYVGRNT